INFTKDMINNLPVPHGNFQVVSKLSAIVLECGKKGIQHFSDLKQVLDATILNLYFDSHMKEQNINVLDLVENDIDDACELEDFAKKSSHEKLEIIQQLHLLWTNPANEINKRMKMFGERSSEIIKPIWES